ncbi:MAG: tRNA adenosine(34) deaminase TadA [Clostridiales bacterium]|nr:tRNA adenosine(34) deaminase TadA [Clostridiales bacterium]
MCDMTFMQKAYEQALKAYENDETPIGCVIEYEGKIIGSGYNLRNTKKNPLCHAEIAAINEASQYLGDWRLEGTTIYVTVEPCPMCAGAIVQARIKRLVYGAENKKAGCAGSVINLFELSGLNHRVEVTGGVMREETSKLMSLFFEGLRNRNL